ncbi:hypothetical protein J6590_013918 [Homalodisca vitripennis]|nr:hypothetical protein J6590_013918 [Homalodisca vitripennis]
MSREVDIESVNSLSTLEAPTGRIPVLCHPGAAGAARPWSLRLSSFHPLSHDLLMTTTHQDLSTYMTRRHLTVLSGSTVCDCFNTSSPRGIHHTFDHSQVLIQLQCIRFVAI